MEAREIEAPKSRCKRSALPKGGLKGHPRECPSLIRGRFSEQSVIFSSLNRPRNTIAADRWKWIMADENSDLRPLVISLPSSLVYALLTLRVRDFNP